MALVNLPNPLTDGTPAIGAHVRANDDTIVAQVNGGLEDVNIKVGAAIDCNKLSNVAGFRCKTDRIEDDAITFDKLSDHASIDANRAVGTNHIRDLAVTTAKLAAGAVTTAKLDALAVAAGNLGAASVISSKVKTANIDWVLNAGTILNLATLSAASLLAANGMPLFIESRVGGVPAAAGIITSLWFNTATSQYYTLLINVSGATYNFAVNPITVRLVYIPVA